MVRVELDPDCYIYEPRYLRSPSTPSKMPRAVPRVEKGVKKVDDHQVKENAATLLFMLSKAIMIPDADARQQFLAHVVDEIESVVDDFGFTTDRIHRAADDRATAILAAINTSREVAALKTQHRQLGTIIQSLDTDDVDSTDESLVSEAESVVTARGFHKRQKVVKDAVELVADMNTTLQAMKSDKVGRRASAF